jgi:hypothetical protein
LTSPRAVEAINCFEVTAPGNCYFDPFRPDGTIAYKQFDLSLQKEWDTGTDIKFRVRGDLINAFNWRNYGAGEYSNWRGWDGGADPNFGRRTGDGIERPTRTFKLSVGFVW